MAARRARAQSGLSPCRTCGRTLAAFVRQLTPRGDHVRRPGPRGYRLTLEFPATRRLPALSATGNVVDNVFVMRVPTLFERGAWPTTAVWRPADGHVVKTIDERPFHP